MDVQPVTALVFGVDSFPEQLPPDVAAKAVYVPLTVDLAMPRGFGPFDSWADLSHEEQRELAERLDASWEEFCKHVPGFSTKGRFEFDSWQIHLLYVQLLVRRLIARYCPARVVFPANSCDTFETLTDDEARLRWIMRAVLFEETKHLSATTFLEKSVSDSTGRAHPRILLDRLRAWIDEHRRQRAIERVRRRFRRSREISEPTGECPIVVVAQPAKVKQLFRLPVMKSRILYLPYQYLDDVYPRDAAVDRSPASDSSTCEVQLWRWLRGRVVPLEGTSRLVQDVLLAKPGAVITDAEHDARVQSLLQSCIQEGLPAATVPEGAVAYVRERQRCGRALRYVQPGLTHFVLTAEEGSVLVAEGARTEDVQVSGYLGDTFQPSMRRMVKGAWTDRRARLQWRLVERQTTTVGLSLDFVCTARTMGLPGDTPTVQTLYAYKSVLRTLACAGFTVLVTARNRSIADLFEQGTELPNVWYLRTTPWQWTARRSDVMVSWISSVAWESLALGVPVIVPDLSPVPGPVSVTLRDVPPPWSTVVRNLDSLVAAVNDVTSRRRRGEFPDLAPVSCQPDAVGAWVRQSLGVI